jgi:RNA-directed DNA polymerase
VTAVGARKPNGGADACLVTSASTLNADLMSRVLTRSRSRGMQRAWEQVRANHGAPGIDGMTVEEFPDFVRSPQWATVKETLKMERIGRNRSDGHTSRRPAAVSVLLAFLRCSTV